MRLNATLLLSFPPIPRPTTVFALISLSGLWILATLCRQLELSVLLDQDKSGDDTWSTVLLVSETTTTTTSRPHQNLDDDDDNMTTTKGSTITLQFESAEQLQTSLVLLPLVEEEGMGARVEQCTTTSADDDDMSGAIVEALVLDNDVQQPLRDMDFAEILATLRSAGSPVKLLLSTVAKVEDSSQHGTDQEENASEQEEVPVVNHEQGESPKVVDEAKIPVFEEEKKVDPADIVHENNKDASTAEPSPTKSVSAEESVSSSMQHSIMSWASRISATSVQLATERAQQAMEVAVERRKAAAAAVAISIPPTFKALSGGEVQEANNTPSLDVGLFIQTSSGAFLPLPKEKQRLSSELRVTNASLLTIRKSAAEACSPQDYSFQWYRSIERNHTGEGKALEWAELPGANSRTFQPTAVDVGHQIRCVVTKLDGDQSDDDDDDDHDDEHERVREKAQSATLDTVECVSAALALFNGSRQALSNGAQFGGIKGLGNAMGRMFRIKVTLFISKDAETKKATSTSSVCIYQVCGNTFEPMHPEDEPILGITASTDHESAKDFELILPDEMPQSASMVVALATNGRLQLSAPNRLGRESLLLAIGIANYTGEPSALGPTSVLFCDPEIKCEEDMLPLAERQDSDIPDENAQDPVTPTEPAKVPPPVLPKQEPQQRSVSLDCSIVTNEADVQRMKELEKELNALRSKLSKKDKAMTELQKQVKSSDSSNAKLREEIAKKDKEMKETKRSLLVAERRMQSQEDDMKRMRSDHTKAVESLNKEMDSRAATITELEKTVRILQNEKAVLTATVEARDSKLSKMNELQASLEASKAEAAKTNDLRNQLQQTCLNYDALAEQMKHAEDREKRLQNDLEAARGKIRSLEEKVKTESEKTSSCRAELDTQQMKIQKLKAERNNYKQKSDSLSKEISKVCRQGRTIKDVEKIISDDAARRQEVELLREQKRKALEDLDHYRTSFEQSRAAQKLAGLDQETTKILERNAELERLLADLTEYVSAKEMQLETLKAVNEALQTEITGLHRSQMSKNLGKNDV